MEASREEEFWNALTHFIGLLGSIIGICYLLFINNDLPILSLSGVLFFGFGLVSVYLSSTLYHYVSEPVLKEKLRIFDHISIYYLIAGSYAPVCLITLLDKSGIYIFIAVCIIAIFGTIFKLFYTGKFEKLSLGLYLLMGWLVVAELSQLLNLLSAEALTYMAIGGVFYTLGTIFYASKRIPYGHFIWHLFVLGGSVSHYFMIYSIV